MALSKAARKKAGKAAAKVRKCLTEKLGKKDKETGKKVLSRSAYKKATVKQRADCGSKTAKAQLARK
jgi:hypothetical protein